MSSKFHLRDRRCRQAPLLFCPIVLLLYSSNSSAVILSQVVGPARNGRTGAGAGLSTEGDAAALEACSGGGSVGTARPTAIPTLMSKCAACGKNTKERAASASNALHATSWNAGKKCSKGANRDERLEEIEAAHDGSSVAIDVYDIVNGALQDLEAVREAVKRRRVTKSLAGTVPAQGQSAKRERSPAQRDTQMQSYSMEDANRQQEDTLQQTVSLLYSSKPFSSGPRICRDWRRAGPHTWLLESPFFVESTTMPAGLELVYQLVPLRFYGVDEEGDVVMYLQLSDIDVGVARTQLSDEQIKSVFRFRFFAVFGWLAPEPYAKAKVFIDARRFKVTDALLNGGISFAAAFITGFASTMGQTPLAAASGSNSSYSAYSYNNSRATSLSSHSSHNYYTVMTQVDRVSCPRNGSPEAGHNNVISCHGKDHSSIKSPARTLNLSAKGNTNNSSGVSEGFDRLREVHVLEAPFGSEVFFRLARTIVGVQLPVHFYSTPADVLRSKFAVTTGLGKALLSGVQEISHAWTQRATIPSKQQNSNTRSLRKSSSRTYGESHRPPNSSRRSSTYIDQESSSLREAVEHQEDSSMSSHDAFALERCFVEFVAHLRSDALTDRSQAHYCQ